MSTYETSEIVPASKAAKQFGTMLSDLKSKKREKVLISRNNVPEAVILPIEKYESLQEIADLLEHIHIARTIHDRKHEKASISLSALLSKEGIDPDEL